MKEREFVTQIVLVGYWTQPQHVTNHPDPWILHVIHPGESHPHWGLAAKPILSLPTDDWNLWVISG
jgi:hypothetical protein